MNAGKLVLEIDANTEKFNKKYNDLRNKMEDYIKEYDRLQDKKAMVEFNGDKKGLDDVNFQIESLNRKIAETSQEMADLHSNSQDVNQDVKNIGESAKNTGNNASNMGNNFEISFQKGLKSLKTFALGLIGIRGAYSLVRKASSAWLSQDTELAKKFENVWLALGAALQPILEALADIMLKLVGYINVFVKAFTGGRVDLIAKANAMALKKQSDAMKELKNQTYGFDELNIQQTNESSGSSSNVGIPDINLDPEVVAFVEKIGTTLGNVYDKLKGIAKWFIENVGVGGTIMLAIGTLIGVKALPALGGSGLLAILAIAYAIYDAFKLIGLIKDFDDVKDSAKDVSDQLDTTKKSAEGMKDKIMEAFDGKTYEEKRKGIGNLLDLTRSQINQVDSDTTRWEKDTSFSLKGIMNSFTGVADASKKQRDITVTATKQQIDALIELAEQGELTDDEFEELVTLVADYFDTMQKHNEKTMGLLHNDVDDVENYVMKLTKLRPDIIVKMQVEAEDKTKDTVKKIQQNFQKLGVNILKTGNVALNPLNLITEVAKFAKNPLSYAATGGVLNKSALGSIVNNPGRGVYVGGNTIAGESGKEGIIPLTDPNAMTELGETIGRYITVNLTNITKLDSKTINKETKKVGNEMGFATNGGV